MDSNECYVYISNKKYYSSSSHSDSHIYELPCYPEEVSDSVSVNWSDVSIIGRTPIMAYNSTGLRNISFSMDLHLDMMTNYVEGHDRHHRVSVILGALRSAAYPIYSSKGLKPPMVIFVFGELKMKGILRSVGFQWKKPIIDKKYSLCTVSINMDEIADPLRSEGDSIGSAYNPNEINDNSTAEWIEV